MLICPWALFPFASRVRVMSRLRGNHSSIKPLDNVRQVRFWRMVPAPGFGDNVNIGIDQLALAPRGSVQGTGMGSFQTGRHGHNHGVRRQRHGFFDTVRVVKNDLPGGALLTSFSSRLVFFVIPNKFSQIHKFNQQQNCQSVSQLGNSKHFFLAVLAYLPYFTSRPIGRHFFARSCSIHKISTSTITTENYS